MSELTFAINIDRREYISSDKFPYWRVDSPGKSTDIGSMQRVLALLTEGFNTDYTTEYSRQRRRAPSEEEQRQLHISFSTTTDGRHLEMPAHAGSWSGCRIVIANERVMPLKYLSKAAQLRGLETLLSTTIKVGEPASCPPYVADASKISPGKHGIFQYSREAQTWIHSCMRGVTIFEYARKHWHNISLSVIDSMAEFGLSRTTASFYNAWMRERLGELLNTNYVVSSERNVSGMMSMRFDLFWLSPYDLADFLKQYKGEMEVKCVKAWLRKQIITPLQREIINRYRRIPTIRWNAFVADSHANLADHGSIRLLPEKRYFDAAMELSFRENAAAAGSATAALMRELTGNLTNRRVIQIDDKESIDAESTPDTVDPE